LADNKFDVRLDSDAAKHYKKLDNSVIPAVNKAIDELVFRADEVGKTLKNKHSTKLAGCREIKLRAIGIRIVFRITNEMVDILRIVYVLSIEHRSKDLVFKVADKRYEELRKKSKAEMPRSLLKQTEWANERKGKD